MIKGKHIIVIVLVLVFLALTGCGTRNNAAVKAGDEQPKSEDKQSQSSSPSTYEASQDSSEDKIKDIINERANEVLTAIKDYDMDRLSQAVHPDKGVRFTPYAYVSKENLVFNRDELRKLGRDSAKYLWGSYDGSGEPINLTFSEYYKGFVYDVDFINAKEIGFNRTIGRGNTADNSSEFYKASIIVEYHFPGFDPQYEGLDWRSLRLVFEKADDNWYLVGIIHDQWTI